MCFYIEVKSNIALPMQPTQHSQRFPSVTVVNLDFVIHHGENALFVDISVLNRIVMIESS